MFKVQKEMTEILRLMLGLVNLETSTMAKQQVNGINLSEHASRLFTEYSRVYLKYWQIADNMTFPSQIY